MIRGLHKQNDSWEEKGNKWARELKPASKYQRLPFTLLSISWRR